MVLLVVISIVALVVGFCGAVAVTAALLALLQPKTRMGAVLCFVAAAVVISLVLVAMCSSSTFFRYSAEGPVIWFLVWPTLGCVAVGVIAALFAVSPIRRRLLAQGSHAATPTI